MSETIRGRAIEGLLLMLGLIVGGWILGSQIKATRLADRYVTVKGLVERNVKSDLAIGQFHSRNRAPISRPSSTGARRTKVRYWPSLNLKASHLRKFPWATSA